MGSNLTACKYEDQTESTQATKITATKAVEPAAKEEDVVEKNVENWMDTEGWVADDHCLVKQVFMENDLKDLDDKKTSNGWTLNKATICAQKRKQHVGVYAGDDECYELFSPMFDKVIQLYHGVDVAQNKAEPENYEKKDMPTLPPGDAIKSTRIRTARNLRGFPFTNNMTKEQRLEIEGILKKVFEGFEDERLKGTYHPLTGMPEEEKKKLIDLHYLFVDDDETLRLGGTYDDWSHGRGIFINNKAEEVGTFIVWVGEEDQMRIMAMAKGSDAIAIWELFYAGLKAVHEGVQAQGEDFAFLESHGYLATCPTNLGTGMRASVHVDLPKWKAKADLKAFVKECGMKIDIRGTRGESVNTDGYTVYDVSNKERLGSDCGEQIKAMVDGVARLLSECEAADDCAEKPIAEEKPKAAEKEEVKPVTAEKEEAKPAAETEEVKPEAEGEGEKVVEKKDDEAVDGEKKPEPVAEKVEVKTEVVAAKVDEKKEKVAADKPVVEAVAERKKEVAEN